MEMWLKIAISRQNSYIQPEIQTVNGFRAQKLLEGQPILKGANIHLNISQSLPIPIVNTYRVYWSILYLSFSWIMRSFSLKGGFCPLDYLNENNKSTYYLTAAAAAAKSLQLCPTLCDPIDGSPPGSPIPGILQARTLEWVAISFSNAWKWKVKVKSLTHELQPTRLLRPWDFPGKSTGVGCHCLLHTYPSIPISIRNL